MTIGTVTSTTKETRIRRVFSFMPFMVYILYSVALDQYYTGQTQDLKDRLFRHKNGAVSFSRKRPKDQEEIADTK
jgi:hypothetical protein